MGTYLNDYDYVCRKCSDIYPAAKTSLRWNPNTRECIVTCPPETPEKSAGRCQTCREISTYYDHWDATTQKCVSWCPSDTYSKSFPEYNNTHMCTSCYLRFGANKPYYSSSQSSCKNCSSYSTNYIWNPNTLECVSACPQKTPSYYVNGSSMCQTCSDMYNVSSYWTGSTCAYCPKSTPNWNSYTQKCEAPCPENAPVWN